MKLPLDTADVPDAQLEVHALVVDADGDVVADCLVLGRQLEECERTAQMIVEAVNNYTRSVWDIPIVADSNPRALI